MHPANDLLVEIERLTEGNKLARPHPVRDRQGRWRRHPGAEWDWFYGLPESERTFIQREYMTDKGLGPDELATWLGVGIDEAMDQWLAAVRGVRRRYMACLDPLSNEWDLADVENTSSTERLLGPDELAELLAVQRNTIAQWRHRQLLPAPDLVISGLPIWRQATISDWAVHTGRTLEAS